MNVGDIVIIRGDVVRTWDKVKPDGWTWFVVRDNKGCERKVSGCVLQPICSGMTIDCECVVDYNDRYGWSFKLCGDVNTNVVGRYNVIDYLTSSLFKGVGMTTASKLYDAFGDNTIEMLENDFDTVCKTVSLTQKQKSALSNVSAYGPLNKLRKEFPSLGIKAPKVLDYFAKKGKDIDRIVAMIKYDPSVLSKVVPANVIDDVYIHDLKIPLDDNDRMSFVINSCIPQVTKKFHNTYVSKVEEFDELAKLILKRPMSSSVWDGINKFGNAGQWLFFEMLRLSNLSSNFVRKDIQSNGDVHFYDEYMFRVRQSLISKLVHLIAYAGHQTSFYQNNKIRFHNWLNSLQNNVLNKEQMDAIENSVTNPLSFISGGPGRGKTFTASALLNFWLDRYDSALLLAPTGRAVNKLKTETGYENAETIARFILMNADSKASFNNVNDEFKDVFGKYMSNSSRTLVLIDEVSMLNFDEAAQLLGIINRCTIVFLGDIDQLAPVEPGCFLSEILKINKVYPLPISYLKQNMRTSVQVLSDNSTRIMDGTLTPKLHYDNDFAFDFTFCGTSNSGVISISDADKLTCEKAFDYYMDALKNGCDVSDIMLLCPTHKGESGTDVMNKYFQEHLNPLSQRQSSFVDKDGYTCYSNKGFECKGFKMGDITVRIMDRLMQTVNDAKREWVRFEDNDPDKDVVEEGFGFFNGDVGTVVRYYDSRKDKYPELLLQLDDGRFIFIPCDYEIYKELCLGYAVTIHKAQGSEAKYVIVVLPESLTQNTVWLKIPFLTKNLLYTAVTRAKQSVQILGSKTAFSMCLQYEQYLGAATVADEVIRQITNNRNRNSYTSLMTHGFDGDTVDM